MVAGLIRDREAVMHIEHKDRHSNDNLQQGGRRRTKHSSSHRYAGTPGIETFPVSSAVQIFNSLIIVTQYIV